MVKTFVLICLVAFPIAVMSQALTPQFITPAKRALKAISQDTLTRIDPNMDASPTADRIAEADAATSTPADKEFLERLRDLYRTKVANNVMRHAVQITAELKADMKFACRECKEREQFIKDYMVQDRTLAKNQISEDDNVEELTKALAKGSRTSVPAASKRSRKPQE
jgi:hypothetical protein